MRDWRHFYKFPLTLDEGIGWVWDEERNLVFSFEFNDIERQRKIVDVINGNSKLPMNDDTRLYHYQGTIMDDPGNEFITIRGWGNLTGNKFNLNPPEAAYVQDTFAEFIVDQLNK